MTPTAVDEVEILRVFGTRLLNYGLDEILEMAAQIEPAAAAAVWERIAAGASAVAVPGQPIQQYDDGMLVLATNRGETADSGFAAIPELGVNIGYMLTPRLKATVGYSFLYWSRVLRPADRIDMHLNPSLFQGGALDGYPAPEGKFVAADYWAQGLNFGLDYRY